MFRSSVTDSDSASWSKSGIAPCHDAVLCGLEQVPKWSASTYWAAFQLGSDAHRRGRHSILLTSWEGSLWWFGITLIYWGCKTPLHTATKTKGFGHCSSEKILGCENPSLKKNTKHQDKHWKTLGRSVKKDTHVMFFYFFAIHLQKTFSASPIWYQFNQFKKLGVKTKTHPTKFIETTTNPFLKLATKTHETWFLKNPCIYTT